MVCMDGFILTHAYERVDMPAQADVDRFLPSYEPRQVLDPNDPVTIGAMVGPEAFTEVRYLAHAKQMQALDLIPQVAREFREIFGRESGGLVKPYRLDDAETIVIAMGSVLGTIKDTVDDLRNEGVKIGVLGITSFRPFPISDIRDATAHAKRIVVIEKCFAVGIGGIVSRDVRSAVRNRPQPVLTVVAGLGGRAITKASVHKLLLDAIADSSGGSLVTAAMGEHRLCYRVAEPGEHWVANSLAVMAAVHAAGGDMGAAGLALAEMGGREFGAHMSGVTLSHEQLTFANQRMQTQGLAATSNLRLQDYRDIDDGPYDAICSIEMLEAVGQAYWPTYFESVARLLKSGGKACIQTIVIDDALFDRYVKSTDFIQQYIFPGGCLPCPREFRAHAERAGLKVIDELAFGLDYAETLRRWRHQFMADKAQVLQLGFDERFIRI
mgnify:CR=1 FL=1